MQAATAAVAAVAKQEADEPAVPWLVELLQTSALPARTSVVQLHLCSAVRLLSGKARHGAK
jgi:hypothetical protein